MERVASLNSVLKKKIVAVDGRDAHTPYTQAQSLDGRLVQKNISSTTNDTITNYSLKNAEEILEILKQENIDLKEYIYSQSIHYPQVTAQILEFDGVRFRAVVDKQRGGLQLPLSPFTNQIITFYSDRNLKDRMKFLNPQVEQYYQSNQHKRRKP